MIDKKLLFVAAATAALALPGIAGAQVAGVNANAGVKANTNAALGTVTDAVNKAADTATDAADKAMAEVGANATVAAGPIVAATVADLKAGAMVHDIKGGMVGTVESATADGAVVATGKSRVQLPLASFAKNEAGLVISVSKDELDAQASGAAGATAGSR